MSPKFMYRVTAETCGVDPVVVGDYLFEDLNDALSAYHHGGVKVPSLRWTTTHMRVADLNLTHHDIAVLAQDWEE